MGVETDIEYALFWHLAAAVVPTGGVELTPHSDDAPFDDDALYSQPTMAPVAWPNRPFSPPPQPYIRVDHLRNRNTRLYVAGDDPHWRQGILQVTVVAPLHGGVQPATEIADIVAAAFAADAEMHRNGIRVRVQSAPDVATPVREDSSWNVATSIYYEAFA
jgi:hypothetical protein